MTGSTFAPHPPGHERHQERGNSLQAKDDMNFAHRDSSFINFDDEREFDFSRITAKPHLRLVVSNSVSVKA